MKLLNSKKDELIPEGYTIDVLINRCYYDSFNYASEWLKKKYDFVPLKKHEYDNPKDYKSAHKQIQDELTAHKKGDVRNKLRALFILRNKVDYPPLNRITLTGK